MSLAEPTAALRQHLTTHLSGDPDWVPALRGLEEGRLSLHLAILLEPFLSLLMTGTKTVESRFSRIRCSPYEAVAAGDLIAVKRPGWPIAGIFGAGEVTFHQLTPSRVIDLRVQFADRIGAPDDAFSAKRADCRYATLVAVTNARPIPALPFAKRDRRGWVRLTALAPLNGHDSTAHPAEDNSANARRI